MYLCTDFIETQFKIHTKLKKCNLVCIIVEVLNEKLPEIHTKLQNDKMVCVLLEILWGNWIVIHTKLKKM